MESSSRRMYSSAVWERAESPGPILKEGQLSSDWSESVGSRRASKPISTARRISGCSISILEELRQNERAFIIQPVRHLSE